jgi:lipopolysaccharide transport system permease protein
LLFQITPSSYAKKIKTNSTSPYKIKFNMTNNTTSVITPRKSLLDFKFDEIWQYRDLLVLFFKRDITVTYKQTILGPLWFIIQPLLTTLMFLMVFGKIAGISTEGVPPILFYMGGITIWNFFADCLRLNSDTFVKNAGLFGKVYFPRIITPLSVVASNLVKFGIQLVLFLSIYFYFIFSGTSIQPNATLFLLPVYLIILALLGLGFGLVVSALTTKYRDFTFLIQFGVQLWMYATPVIYPISKIPEKYKYIILANPISSVVEAFKYSFTGKGFFNSTGLIYSLIFSIVVFVLGVSIFNRTEKTFMDTV